MSNLSTKTQPSALQTQSAPFYYDITVVGNPFEADKRCCFTEKDLKMILELYPDSTYQKVYLPHTPQTVDVPYVRVAPDLELPMQQILPESKLEKLNI